MTPARPRVRFVCTHNSARSQSAEAFQRAMAERGIDIRAHGTP